MPTIHFHLDTPLPPAAVLAGITDFGAGRSKIWPNVDAEHFQLHAQGPGWADVTEGSAIAGGVWERERYTWDSAAGTVSIETVESNTWGKGSRWDYRLVPTDSGTRVVATVVRSPTSWRGRLIALALNLNGSALLRSQTEKALGRIAALNAGR
jgi:hypothetical protein